MKVTNEQVEMIANADPDAYEMVHDEELVVAMATELRQLRKLRDAMDAAGMMFVDVNGELDLYGDM